MNWNPEPRKRAATFLACAALVTTGTAVGANVTSKPDGPTIRLFPTTVVVSQGEIRAVRVGMVNAETLDTLVRFAD